jgi:hypothetical protein
LITALFNVLNGTELTDIETCYKMFWKETSNKFEIDSRDFAIEPELTAKFVKMGLKIKEIPISYKLRGYKMGKKLGFKDLFMAIRSIIRFSFRA